MAMVINTNVSSLTAQRALANSNAELQTAMERLSTGSKINTAADDAAGLAMTQRMTAQVRGLAMAVKNANDGAALTQSIEGALAEVSDMLQRMRELSLQAANGTNSSADRTFLQSEVNLLIQEITRVATNTRYNGELILDGTFLNKSLQVGLEEGENIIFSVESVAAESVGAYTLVGEGQGALAAAQDAASNPTTIADDVEIFGFLGTRATAASVGDTAKETAVKINNLTGETGVKAYAKTYAALSSASTDLKTYSVKINGYQTGNFVISSGDAEGAVDAINQISGSTGVTASSANNKVLLFDVDGDDILIENTQTLANHSDLVVQKVGESGEITDTVGSAVSLQLSGANDATRVTGTIKMVSPNAFSIDQKAVHKVDTVTVGTLANYAGEKLTIGDGKNSVTVNYTGGAPANIDTLLANIQAADGYGDLLVDVTKASATTLAYTWKAAGASPGTAAYLLSGTNADSIANTTPGTNSVAQVDTVTVGTLANYAGETLALGDGTNSITVNYTGGAPANIDALLANIQAATGYADLAFTVAKASGTTLSYTWKAVGESPGTALYGYSSLNGESVATSTAGVDSLGYYTENTNTSNLINLTQINISTMVKAGDSISIIDAALDKVAQMRSNLGAIENRLNYTISNLMNIAEKTADARSRLDDADFALESARLAKAQVIQQAGTSMLAQANQMTQLVLELIR